MFTFAGHTRVFEKQLADFVGLKPEDFPAIRIIRPGEADEKIIKFKYDESIKELNKHKLSEWIKGF